MNTILLLLLAIAPPTTLMVLIYWMDSHEPEALKNVLMAMVIGALSIIPAIIIEVAFETVPIFTLPGLAGRFYESFFLVAPSEELAKFFFIYLFIRKKPFYSEIIDGIVYFGAGALGFALLENVFYVFSNGFSVGVLRAFTSIPIHAFCGIIIGYHAGLAKFSDQLNPRRLIFSGLFLAYLTHALFNTIVSADSLLTLLFIPLLAVIYYAIYKILHRGKQLSKANDQTLEDGVIEAVNSLQTCSAPVPADTYFSPVRIETLSVPSPVSPIITSREYSQVRPIKNYRLADVFTDNDGRKYLVPKKEKWKAIISRILLITTGLLWLLVFTVGENPPTELWDLVIGMILLTIVPFMIGLLLEVSYQRRKRRKIYVDDEIFNLIKETSFI
ncbi:MAG: PrsW family glutamic-type intramembrane protease [Eubacteriales bacterium]